MLGFISNTTNATMNANKSINSNTTAINCTSMLFFCYSCVDFVYCTRNILNSDLFVLYLYFFGLFVQFYLVNCLLGFSFDTNKFGLPLSHLAYKSSINDNILTINNFKDDKLNTNFGMSIAISVLCYISEF